MYIPIYTLSYDHHPCKLKYFVSSGAFCEKLQGSWLDFSAVRCFFKSQKLSFSLLNTVPLHVYT